jgi:putative ABC transport system permease protein
VTLDRYVWMPIAAFERAFGAPASVQVFARATDVSRTGEAEDHARISMRARRHLGPAADDTFDIITPEASRSFVAAITERIGAAGPPISLMALIAAIVVITNTTLVSVTQRTREIGIRRAVGANRAHVLVETLAESSVIALVGGLVGLAASAAVLAFGSRALNIPLSLEWPTALGSLAAAGLSGLVAGWYPAHHAASLDVITALRNE